MSGYPARMRFCDLDDTPVKYRVGGMLTMNGKFQLNAYQKSGKTTTSMHLLKSFDTGDDFLGRTVIQTRKPWMYANLELPQNMLRKYAEDEGLDIQSRNLLVADFCGRGAELMELLTDPDQLASQELFDGLGGLIIDPLAPLLALAGINENDNQQVRYTLEKIDAGRLQLGIPQLGIVNHTGHGDKGRGRGASANGDWADVTWNLEREPAEKVATLSVVGRGVLPQTIAFRKEQGQLVVCDPPPARQSRKEEKDTRIAEIREAREKNPGASRNKIAEITGISSSAVGRFWPETTF